MEPVVSNRISLTDEELRRYSRHLILSEVGREGQERLKAARVALVGAGGLGSPSAIYLSAAGIGTIGMVDFDRVEEGNLQRQVLHGSADVGRTKLQSAKEKIAAINPNVQFIPHEERLTSANALAILKDYDVVVDGADNFATRYLVNDACVMLKKPNVYASISRFEGMASVFAPHLGGPCYRCWYPEPPPPGRVPSCAEAGVLGVLCGVMGSLQALETVKLILGKGTPLLGRLLRFDALAMVFREHRIPRDPDCPLCGRNPTITMLQEVSAGCPADEISVETLEEMRGRGEDFILVDVRDPDETAVSEIPGSVKIPLPELPRRLDLLPRDRLVVLYCQAGWRSLRALNFLREHGYTRLKNLAGGMAAWQQKKACKSKSDPV